MRVALLVLLLSGCLDVTVTVKVPCRATVIKRDTTRTDTVLVFTADSLPCPK